ncbi:MAG TPA: RpiB/LacA/LacB family sugar-phosphate isomerase [Chloroflexota bacterium]
MKVALAGDHWGVAMKAQLLEELLAAGHQPIDLGAKDATPSDYPLFARRVGEAIRDGRAERGIIICGSGVGVCVAANKIDGIRAGMCHDTYSAHQGVEHDDMNVLCLGARIVGGALASEVVAAFLGARLNTTEERYARRLKMVEEIERERR